MSFARTIDGALTLGAAGLMIASTLPFSAPLLWFGELAASLRWQMAWAAIALAVVAGLRRHWIGAGLCGGLALFHLAPLAHLWTAAPARTQATGPELRLASYNLAFDNDDHGRFLDWVRRTTPDILAIQELSDSWRAVWPELERLYPHSVVWPEDGTKVPRPDFFGIAIASRYPLEVRRVGNDPWRHMPWYDVDVSAGGHSLHLVVAHPIAPADPKMRDMRDSLLRRILRKTEWSDDTVLAGDLNISTYSPMYTELLETTGLTDSRVGFGRLAGFTLPGPIRGVTVDIDHIMVGADIEVVDRSLGPDLGGDHRPALATLRLR